MTSSQPEIQVGLHLERTQLAWQRTSLAFTVGVLAGARLFVDQIGALSVLSIGIGVSCAVGFSAVGRFRYGLRPVRAAVGPWVQGAIPLVSLAGAVMAVGSVGLVFSFVRLPIF